MSRIIDMALEPQTVYEGNKFVVKVKVQDDYKYKKYLITEDIKYKVIIGSDLTITDADESRKASVIEIRGAGEYKRRLPTEYQEVEYIQNTGGAWIDTGIQPCMNKIRCLCEMSPMTNSDTAFFGSRGTYFLFYNVSGNYFWPISKCETIQGTLTVGNKYVVDWNKGTLEVTGTDGVYQKGVRSNNTQDTRNLYIFNFNPVDGRQALAKVYYFKIYIEDVLVRDFIPCKRKSDNIAGLYDLVENTFYSSITQTQLSSGPELDTKNVEGDNNIFVSNKNLINIADRSGTISNFYYYDIPTNYLLEEGQTYTVSYKVTASLEPFNVSVGAGTIGYQRDIKTITGKVSGNIEIIFTPNAYQLDLGKKLYLRVPRYNTPQTSNYEIKNIQLEKGNVATDYIKHIGSSNRVDLRR
jgi:hypothetical protein